MRAFFHDQWPDYIVEGKDTLNIEVNQKATSDADLNSRIESAAKIVNEFENPKLDSEKSSYRDSEEIRFRDGEDERPLQERLTDIIVEQYARSSRYQRRLNEIGRDAGPLHDEDGRFIPSNARWHGEQALKALGRWRQELLEERSRCSRAGQAEIDAELADLDYRQEYYRRLSQGEDVDNSRLNRRSYLQETMYRNTGETEAEPEGLSVADIDDFDYDMDTHFRDADFDLQEFITKMKTDAAKANANDLEARREAVKAIGGNLRQLRQAMSRQRKYDIATIKSITDLARIMLDGNLLDDMSKVDIKRLLSATVKSVGREDVSRQVEQLMYMMVDNQLRQGAKA
ncbi:MAG: hypothetical protein K2M80_05490, partial [Muribaculaceae bacterium]|nr:hypothetical protein [Muribaculaceae bacterium]